MISLPRTRIASKSNTSIIQGVLHSHFIWMCIEVLFDPSFIVSRVNRKSTIGSRVIQDFMMKKWGILVIYAMHAWIRISRDRWDAIRFRVDETKSNKMVDQYCYNMVTSHLLISLSHYRFVPQNNIIVLGPHPATFSLTFLHVLFTLSLTAKHDMMDIAQ
jgi:hypothetical protein